MGQSLAVMYGGEDGEQCSDQTNLWNGTSWSAATGIPSNPDPRLSPAVAADTLNNILLLFGGQSVNFSTHAGTFRGDTWMMVDGVWADTTPSISPSARDETALAFDSGRGRFVLFGGQNDAALFNDTWEYDYRSGAGF